MNKKALIIIIVAVLVLLIVGATLIITNGKKAETKKQKKEVKEAITAEGIIKDESYGGLNFTNTTLVNDNGQYTLSIDVTNPTKADIDLEQVNIVLKDKDGNEIISLLGYIGDPVKPDETRTITSFADADLSKAASKTIEAAK